MNRNTMLTLQGQVTEMNKLIQSMALSQVNTANDSIYSVQQVIEIGCARCYGLYNTDVCFESTQRQSYMLRTIYTPTSTMWIGEAILTLVGRES